MTARIPIARPAFAPVDSPLLLLELDEEESELEVDEAPSTAVLEASPKLEDWVAVKKLEGDDVYTAMEEGAIAEEIADDWPTDD